MPAINAATVHFQPHDADYRCHVYVRSDSLACVIIADHDYPPRVCFTLMNKVCVCVFYSASMMRYIFQLQILEMFASDFPQSSWEQPAR